MTECVTVGGPLTDRQQAVINTIIADHQPIRLYNFVNADFTDEEDLPGGLVTVFPADAPVHADAVPFEAFQHTVVCQILSKPDGSEWTEADFDPQAIQSAVAQFSNEPPKLNRDQKMTVKDDQLWSPELGSPDSFAGIFKKVHGGKAREADTTFYVVAQAGVPLVSQQLRQKMIRNPNMTYKDLLSDPDFNQAKNLATRNAARLAYAVSRAVKAPIRHTMDIQAKTNAVGGLPFLARPTINQPMSTIQPLKSDIGVFHKVRPIKDAHKDCLVYMGPYEGIAMFSMKGNGNHIGLPATSGRLASPTNDNTRVDYKKRSRGLVWEEQTSLEHPDLHPQAYRPVDAEFLEEMKKMGWQQDGIDNRHYLIPVAVKIFNPKLKRSAF